MVENQVLDRNEYKHLWTGWFFVSTILADLFDPTGSDDPEYGAQKIVNGLQINQLIKDDENDELLAA